VDQGGGSGCGLLREAPPLRRHGEKGLLLAAAELG
jgi:hypothetical protein